MLVQHDDDARACVRRPRLRSQNQGS
jgi:hypothetical protein